MKDATQSVILQCSWLQSFRRIVAMWILSSQTVDGLHESSFVSGHTGVKHVLWALKSQSKVFGMFIS